MPAQTEPRSGLFYGWALGENGWNIGMDANLLRLGRFGFHLGVKNRVLTAPPGSPAAGDSHIVAAGATGAWAGHAGQVAVSDGAGGWHFATPRLGWHCFVEAEDTFVGYTSAGWRVVGGSGGGGGIPEAPTDGKTYGRKSTDWAEVGGTFSGAMAKLNANLSLATRPVTIAWQATDYDTGGFWSVSQPTRFTIPAGVKSVRLHATLHGTVSGFTSAEDISMRFFKNGDNYFRGNGWASNESGYPDSGFTAVSGVLPVIEGDFFEVRLSSSSTGTRELDFRSTSFSIEVIERT